MKRSHSRKECKGGEGTGWDKNIGQSIGWEGDLRVCTVEGKDTGEGGRGHIQLVRSLDVVPCAMEATAKF